MYFRLPLSSGIIGLLGSKCNGVLCHFWVEPFHLEKLANTIVSGSHLSLCAATQNVLPFQEATFQSSELCHSGPGRTSAGVHSGAAVHALLRVAAAESPGRRFKSTLRSLFRPNDRSMSNPVTPTLARPDIDVAPSTGSFGVQEQSGVICTSRLQPLTAGGKLWFFLHH